MDCLFCKIAEGSIPSRKVYEDEHVLAFEDIQPQAPVHLLVIPKKHIASLDEAGPEDAELLGRVALAARQAARDAGIAESGYRVITNIGKDSGQVVFHVHYHVLGGEPLGPLVAKPSAAE
ncbi:histidine triad nucleotide-binding protein [Cohnella zeiphila]|uniref:Histidine triad nucleotide-binding protein n=1 Tax=Cohnella zeiphila TaxID=2761120 RepID=A0A7X0SGV0_9BACL|nr:histidine triad nucleotide-binding protein [Cohnella zeiphila]MBB6729717.1 histidine triad nucleotide-binding protein [Cohnella zeiphila]